ncbi:hypothetical protein GBA65_07400 [Rubrobacter marinus]|uniref:Uncharacterized protein n=1 Tax=Rubrobacter marinus TaxID=2653852 RepID=A0A6G8PVZ6_9ACTN|nr:hypothetical protein [Rubrobacter marinus]QIN78378.1 hypothetical protein GBA65_07400 [Rubrobacter marinus]
MSEQISRAQKATVWGLALLGAAAAVVSIVFGFYQRFFWFDEALHAYNFFALTLLLAVYAYGAVLAGARTHGYLLVLFITVFGLGLGALWEIAEFGYDHFIARPNVILPKLDTIVDMILDTAGALVAGITCLKMLRR